MLIIPIKDGENIEKVLKKYKNKYKKTKQLTSLRSHQHFKKKSQQRREEIARAIYRQEFQKNQEETS